MFSCDFILKAASGNVTAYFVGLDAWERERGGGTWRKEEGEGEAVSVWRKRRKREEEEESDQTQQTDGRRDRNKRTEMWNNPKTTRATP